MCFRRIQDPVAINPNICVGLDVQLSVWSDFVQSHNIITADNKHTDMSLTPFECVCPGRC